MTSEPAIVGQAEFPEVSALEARADKVMTRWGDARIAWRIWGEGPPLVLSHGAQGSWSHWIRNIDLLARSWRVIAVDLPGHGDSDLVEPVDHRTIAAALAAGLTEILDGQAAELVGFSFGGIMFAYLAAYHPQLVRRLTLVGTGGLDTPVGDVRLGRVRGLEGEERQAALKANLLGLMLHEEASVDALALHLLVANAEAGQVGGTARYDLVLPDKLLRILPEVKAPIAAIWGEHDRPHPNPPAQEAAIRASHPELDFRVIAGAGHWAMYERADAFNRTLLDLLESPLPALL